MDDTITHIETGATVVVACVFYLLLTHYVDAVHTNPHDPARYNTWKEGQS